MKKLRGWFGLAILFLLILFSLTGVAFAQGHGGNMISGETLNLAADQTAKTVVVFGGNAVIAGTVKDDLLVINGNVELKSSAQVLGHIVVLGGGVYREEGAMVKEDIFQVDFYNPNLNTLMLAFMMAVGLQLLSMAVSLSLLIFPPLTVWVLGKHLMHTAVLLEEKIWRSLIVGIITSLLVLLLGLLLVVTIVGIPVAVLLLLILMLILLVGYAGVCLRIGQSIAKLLHWEERHQAVITALGALVLAALINIPVIGLFLLLVVGTIGTGAVVLALLGHK